MSSSSSSSGGGGGVSQPNPTQSLRLAPTPSNYLIIIQAIIDRERERGGGEPTPIYNIYYW